MSRSTVPKYTSNYATRFVDAFNVVEDKTKIKSRLLFQNYIDNDSTQISIKSPSIQQLSQRVICCTMAFLKFINRKTETCHRHISNQDPISKEASTSKLPTNVDNLTMSVFLSLEPLNGIPESVLHCVFVAF